MIDTSRPILDGDGFRIERRASGSSRPDAVLRRADAAPHDLVWSLVARPVPRLARPVKVRGFVNALNLALQSIQIPE